MSIADKLTTVAENQQMVYDAGYEKGKAEGGDSYYDTFWDAFQNNGRPQSYYWAFAYRFTDTNYNPKYPIVGSSGSSTNMNNIFYSAGITDTKVDIDASNCVRINAIFNGAGRLKTVRKLIMHEGVYDAANAFSGCTALEHFVVEGAITCDWNMSACPLTKDSIMSVFNALDTTVTGKTVTFKQTAVNAAFTDAEWEALKATKTNWTYALA